MSHGRFAPKGTYVAFNISGGCIGGFNTLAEAKKACAREETAPMGGWEIAKDSHGTAYYARSGCTIYLAPHPLVKLSTEEIEVATRRFRWRESLR